MQKFYELKSPKSPWGDYSNILIAGMSAHAKRKNDLIQLERTGPYVPPISFPGLADVIVTDAFRHQIESAELKGLKFLPVIKKHIVELDWRSWDMSSGEPQEYPEGGEPEAYILSRPHSPEMASRIGDLWEMAIEEGATIEREKQTRRRVVIANSWNGSDIFRGAGQLSIYITEKAKAWLENHAKEHVGFDELGVV